MAYLDSPDWHEVPAYTNYLDQICLYQHVPWLPQAPEYHQVAWSHNDYGMFQQWYTRHPIYSLANLQLLVQKLSIPSSATLLAQVRDWFFLPFTSWQLFLPPAAQAAIGLMLILKGHRLLASLLILGELLAVAAAGATGREPQDYVWIAASAVTLTALCALLILMPPHKHWFRNVFVSFAILLGPASAAVVCSDHARNCRNAAAA